MTIDISTRKFQTCSVLHSGNFFGRDFVVVVAAVVVVALLVTCDWSHYILLWSISVNLRLLKSSVEFLCGGVGCYAQSFSCPTQLQCCGGVVLSFGL